MNTPEIFETKVTKIKNRWHARLIHVDGRIIDEMACELQEDISYICGVMLRWADKCGWISPIERIRNLELVKEKFGTGMHCE